MANLLFGHVDPIYDDRSDRAVARSFGPEVGYGRHPVLVEPLAPSRVDDVRAHALPLLPTWLPSFGWRKRSEALATHRLRRPSDPFADDIPDALVVSCPLRAVGTEFPTNVHAFELRAVGDLHRSSVTDAHRRGRGANSSWVFFACTADEAVRWRAPHAGPSTHGATRRAEIIVDAIEYGVGLVAMPDVRNVATWIEVIAARYQPNTAVPPVDRSRIAEVHRRSTEP